MIWLLFGLLVFFALGVPREPRRPIRIKEHPNVFAQRHAAVRERRH